MKVCDHIMEISSDKSSYLHSIIHDACVPQAEVLHYPSNKLGETLAIRHRPAMPGLAYLKTLMNPSIGDAIELLPGVQSFDRSADGLVAPLSKEDVAALEKFFDRAPLVYDESIAKLTKGSFVNIIAGPYAGNYGKIKGARGGLINVDVMINRSAFSYLIDVRDLVHIERAPERPLAELSPWELLDEAESIDPQNPLLRRLKRSNGMH